MTTSFYAKGQQGDLDASLGLIYRLNSLWNRADYRCLEGDYEQWELILDRIFANLSWKPIKEIDREGKEVEKIIISDKEFKERDRIKEKIRQTKSKIRESLTKRSKEAFAKARSDYYESVLVYDIWLRKTMQSRGSGLYLKETESNPSRALFGNAFSKR